MCIAAVGDKEHSNAERGTRSAERENNKKTRQEEDFLLEICIGAVGDKEQKILKNQKFKERIDECAKIPLPPTLDTRHSTLNFELMLEIKELIDSCYITGNKDRIKNTIKLIAEEGVLAVLEDESLKEQRDAISDEKERLVKSEPEVINDHLLFFELKSEFNLLSAVTRLLSKQYPEKIILTRLEPNVYIRRDTFDIDLKELINIGQSKGWNIGGKHEVCGIAGCSKEMFENTVDFLIEKTS